jgi:hypothetical protein
MRGASNVWEVEIGVWGRLYMLRFVHKRRRGLVPASGGADAKRCGTVWDHRIVPVAGSCIASSHPHGRTSDAVTRSHPRGA